MVDMLGPSSISADEHAGAEGVDGPPALDALLETRNYAGIRVIIPYLDLSADNRRLGEALCTYGSSVVDMDAEDWGELHGVPEELLAAVRQAHMPQVSDDPDRGALKSLAPTYGLFLESLYTRWLQDDFFGALAVLHLMGEYLPLLAWESMLGHAADPRLMPRDVGGVGSRWGSDQHEPEGRRCDHSPTIRGALRVALRIGFPERNGGPIQAGKAWLAYLDRDHARVSGALAQCGTHRDQGRPDVGRECRDPCSVWLRHDQPAREDLADRLALAGVYVEGPLVALRHAAPVGHGFGVPDREEILAAWQRGWQQLTKPWSGRPNPMDGLSIEQCAAKGEPLPGIARFLSVVAGRPIEPIGVLARVDELLAAVVQV